MKQPGIYNLDLLTILSGSMNYHNFGNDDKKKN